MKVNEIQLRHVGRFKELSIPFAPTAEKSSNITVIVGNNGAGKTTLLNSLATSLSWLVARIKTEKGNGSPIAENDIQKEHATASIGIDVSDQRIVTLDDMLFRWSIAKTRTGLKPETHSHLGEVTALADHYRSLLSQDEQSTSLPIIVFYPAERNVMHIPLKRKSDATRSLQQVDGYAGAFGTLGQNPILRQNISFGSFFEWFRDRAEIENASTAFTLEELKGLMQQAQRNSIKGKGMYGLYWDAMEEEDRLAWLIESITKHKKTYDCQLTAVREAIYTFMPDFKNLRIQHKPDLHMSVDKQGEQLNIAQLSQGEKSLLALIGDIARRLAMMNPQMENPLQGNGIVLIDEVDLHLHPQWQRSLVERLQKTFPNCQFVLTTHSPLVISDSDNMLCYELNDGELSVMDDLFGLDVNQVLLQAMDTDIRNRDIQDKLDDLSDAIQDKEIQKAKAMYLELTKILPQGHLELVKSSFMLKRLERILAKNN